MGNRVRKFLIDAAEAAVGEDGDDVFPGKLRDDGLDDGVGVGVDRGGSAGLIETGRDVAGDEPLGHGDVLGPEDAGEDDAG